MIYLREIDNLKTRYAYSYEVCYYVYLAHGNKAEDILKIGVEKQLSGFWIMQLSDLCSKCSDITKLN